MAVHEFLPLPDNAWRMQFRMYVDLMHLIIHSNFSRTIGVEPKEIAWNHSRTFRPLIYSVHSDSRKKKKSKGRMEPRQ